MLTLFDLQSLGKQRRRQDFGSGGTFSGIGLVGGQGAEPPGRQRIFENFKKFLKKITINAQF